MLSDILTGMTMCLRLDVFGMLGVGVILGVIIGALPGLTAIMAVAILLPITFFISPLVGIPFLVAITKGAIFGGSIPAILINTPGTGAAAATTFDGYPLAQKGKARKALEMALYASVIGDGLSDLITIFGIGLLAKLAMLVGSPEYFAIVLWSFSLIAVLTGESIGKGIISAFFGLFLSTIGMDPLSGTPRYTFGILDLHAGLPDIPMIIGLFAISEIFRHSEIIEKGAAKANEWVSKEIFKTEKPLTLKEFKECLRTILRSTLIGTGIGNIPAIGQVPSAFICYSVAKANSKHPEEFGKGSLEGVAAAESGNNAVNGSSLMPLLTFGIPGDVIAAILLSAFMVNGLRPGPNLFDTQGPMVYGILWGLFISNIFLLALGYFLLRYVALIARIPKFLIFPLVAALCFTGAYSVNNSLFDVLLALVFGLIGYAMDKFKFPLAPLLITFILGPLFEETLGQSLMMSDGSLLIFLQRPVSLIFLILTPITLIYLVKKMPKGA